MRLGTMTLASSTLLLGSTLPSVARGASCGTLEYVNPDLLDEIHAALPERQALSDDLVVDVEKSFYLKPSYQGATFHITFIHEGAGYRNQFGYFVYDQDALNAEAPSIDDVLITQGTIWENTSYYYSGGDGSECLQTGHTVDITIDPTWIEYTLGFWLKPDGYDDPSVTPWYTLDELNSDDPQEHAVVLDSIYTDSDILMGWEDLPRRSTGCDNDFNDLMLTISATPDSVITDIIETNDLPQPRIDSDGDGVPDSIDDFPNDPDYVIDNVYPPAGDYFTLAFEDLFPSTGDGDYNDFVAGGKIHERLNLDNKIAYINGIFVMVARGAGYDHEFHLKISNTGPGTWSITTWNGDDEILSTESGDSEGNDLDLVLIPSSREALPSYNTWADQEMQRGHRLDFSFTPDLPVDPETMAQAPYDPYLLVLDTGYDIHQMGFEPISGSGNPTDRGLGFEDDNGYPWELILTDIWNFPLEKVMIDEAYPQFSDWCTSGGSTNQDWDSFPGSQVQTVDGSFYLPLLD